MLYYDTIEANTLSILKRLLNLSQLNSFNLAGGTSLALRYGHRISVDIDLFRMLSTVDIAAMKIAAILGRASKKDFWDIHELLEHYSLDEMIRAYKTKFPNQMLLISIPQALCYFDEADHSQDPISLKNQTWELVQSGIMAKVRDFLS